MTIKKVLAVKNGSYEDRDGKTVNRWVYIGHIHEGKDNDYMTLDAAVNLAAFPRKEGDTRVMVSMFDPKEKDSRQEPPRRQESRRPANDFPDDDLPEWRGR